MADRAPGDTTARAVVGDHRPAESFAQAEHVVGIAGATAGNDHTAPIRVDAADHLGDSRGVRMGRRTDGDRSGSVDTGGGRNDRTTFGEFPGETGQRVAETQVEVHRTGAARPAGGFGHRATSHRSPGVRGRGVRSAGLEEPAGAVAVELRLVDGLGCSDVPQLGRPVGGTDDEWHRREVRLDDGGVEMCRRRSAGAQDDRRPTRGQTMAEGGKGSGSLVVEDVDVEPVVAGECQGERGRARPGRDERVGESLMDPLVDERCAECGSVGHLHGAQRITLLPLESASW